MSRHWSYIYIYYGKFRADEPPLVLYCIYSGKFRAYEPPLVGVVVPEPEEPEHHDGVVGRTGSLVVLYSEPQTSHTWIDWFGKMGGGGVGGEKLELEI